jgi:hypothetical protein
MREVIIKLVENIEWHLLAWENKEESVQAEHADLIEKTRTLLSTLPGAHELRNGAEIDPADKAKTTDVLSEIYDNAVANISKDPENPDTPPKYWQRTLQALLAIMTGTYNLGDKCGLTPAVDCCLDQCSHCDQAIDHDQITSFLNTIYDNAVANISDDPDYPDTPPEHWQQALNQLTALLIMAG